MVTLWMVRLPRWTLAPALILVGTATHAAEVEVLSCDGIKSTLTTQCTGGNTITIASGLSCTFSNASLDGDCTIRVDSPCSSSISNSGARSPALVVNRSHVTLDGLGLSCMAESEAFAVVLSSGSTTFKNTCLDGSACGAGLIGGDAVDERPGTVNIESSFLTGPVLALPVGASTLTISGSTLQGTDEDTLPIVSGVGVDSASLQLSAIVAGASPPITFSASTLHLSNNTLWVSGEAAALSVTDGSTLSLSHNSGFGTSGSGPLVEVDGGTLTLARNLIYDFTTAILNSGATPTSDEDLWVKVEAATSAGTVGGATSLTVADAGLAPLAAGEDFCFTSPDGLADELCIDRQPLWPDGSCSAMVVTDGSGAPVDMIGLLGGLDDLVLPAGFAIPESPPWQTAIGDGDDDGLADDDGDGWVDDLDVAPNDSDQWWPSWYVLNGEECSLVQNQCEGTLNGAGVTLYPVDSQDLPPECTSQGNDGGSTGDDTGSPCTAGQPDCWTLRPSPGCGAETVGHTFLVLSPALLLGLRRRRRAGT